MAAKREVGFEGVTSLEKMLKLSRTRLREGMLAELGKEDLKVLRQRFGENGTVVLRKLPDAQIDLLLDKSQVQNGGDAKLRATIWDLIRNRSIHQSDSGIGLDEAIFRLACAKGMRRAVYLIRSRELPDLNDATAEVQHSPQKFPMPKGVTPNPLWSAWFRHCEKIHGRVTWNTDYY